LQSGADRASQKEEALKLERETLIEGDDVSAAYLVPFQTPILGGGKYLGSTCIS
jgi:hypothetical protein